eukprot:4295527-Pleurochrysis_carterae.AAC.1
MACRNRNGVRATLSPWAAQTASKSLWQCASEDLALGYLAGVEHVEKELTLCLSPLVDLAALRKLSTSGRQRCSADYAIPLKASRS